MVATRQAQFLLAAYMAFQFNDRNIPFPILFLLILKLLKSDSSIGGIDKLSVILINLSVQNCNCNVQALSCAKHMTLVKMVLFHGLNNVNVLFSFKYA